MRDAPYAGVYVLLYESLKGSMVQAALATPTLHDPQGNMRNSVAATINFSAAITSGIVCSVISNPFDVVKTKMQLEPLKYKTMFQTCSSIVRAYGFRSLADGLGLRMSRKALSSALAWTIYEELLRRCGTNA